MPRKGIQIVDATREVLQEAITARGGTVTCPAFVFCLLEIMDADAFSMRTSPKISTNPGRSTIEPFCDTSSSRAARTSSP